VFLHVGEIHVAAWASEAPGRRVVHARGQLRRVVHAEREPEAGGAELGVEGAARGRADATEAERTARAAAMKRWDFWRE
jgi:hypothetical protein